MTLEKAMMLVKQKYLEETQGDGDGPVAGDYRDACELFPALMATAHHLWAREVAKTLA